MGPRVFGLYPFFEAIFDLAGTGQGAEFYNRKGCGCEAT